MAQKKIKVAVVGCGVIAVERHLPAYRTNSRVELVAVCDPDIRKSREIAQSYRIRSYSDYKELFAAEDIDAVSICAPNYLHAEISIAAAEQGIHVLCEKPIATDLAEAKKMVATAAKKQTKLMMAYNQRFEEANLVAKSLLVGGMLGKIISFRLAFAHGGPDWQGSHGNWFFDKKQAAFGVSGDLGVHKINLIQWLLEDTIAEVGAFTRQVRHFASVEDELACILRTASGIVGQLTASWNYKDMPEDSWVLIGEKGTMQLRVAGTMSSLKAEFRSQPGREDGLEIAKQFEQENSVVVREFIEIITLNMEAKPGGEEGVKDLEVILKIQEAAEKGQILSLGGS